MPHDSAQGTQPEDEAADERRAPSGRVVYKAIAAEGEEELARPTSALLWSGLAAGLSMSFSMIGEGLLTSALPDAAWRPLISKLGYSAGFLVVILGRQQLFTENTLTPILPLLQKRSTVSLPNVLRLWSAVLASNLVGALLVALVVAHTSVFEPSAVRAFAEMGNRALAPDFLLVLMRGVFAGWMIALMVWLLPFAETARVIVIIFVTYFVGLGNFSHVIAGAVEAFTVAALGEQSWAHAVGGFIVPALLGNIIGGVLIVAMVNHAQIVAGGSGEDV